MVAWRARGEAASVQYGLTAYCTLLRSNLTP
jgi:hypothetical protein